MWIPVEWLLNVLLFIVVSVFALAGCCSGGGPDQRKEKGAAGRKAERNTSKSKEKDKKVGKEDKKTKGQPAKSPAMQYQSVTQQRPGGEQYQTLGATIENDDGGYEEPSRTKSVQP